MPTDDSLRLTLWIALIAVVAAMVAFERRNRRRGGEPTFKYPPLGCLGVVALIAAGSIALAAWG